MAEFSLKLEKSYFDKYGSDHIVMLKDSNKVQVDKLDPNKGYIQITYLEPYFDEYELELPKRSTLFDRSYNIRKLYPSLIPYMGNIWPGKILVNLANRELFTKIFLTNIHKYTENVFGICTVCSLFANFFLVNSFYLCGSSKFSPTKYFSCTVFVYFYN